MDKDFEEAQEKFIALLRNPKKRAILIGLTREASHLRTLLNTYLGSDMARSRSDLKKINIINSISKEVNTLYNSQNYATQKRVADFERIVEPGPLFSRLLNTLRVNDVKVRPNRDRDLTSPPPAQAKSTITNLNTNRTSPVDLQNITPAVSTINSDAGPAIQTTLSQVNPVQVVSQAQALQEQTITAGTAISQVTDTTPATVESHLRTDQDDPMDILTVAKKPDLSVTTLPQPGVATTPTVQQGADAMINNDMMLDALRLLHDDNELAAQSEMIELRRLQASNFANVPENQQESDFTYYRLAERAAANTDMWRQMYAAFESQYGTRYAQLRWFVYFLLALQRYYTPATRALGYLVPLVRQYQTNFNELPDLDVVLNVGTQHLLMDVFNMMGINVGSMSNATKAQRRRGALSDVGQPIVHYDESIRQVSRIDTASNTTDQVVPSNYNKIDQAALSDAIAARLEKSYAEKQAALNNTLNNYMQNTLTEILRRNQEMMSTFLNQLDQARSQGQPVDEMLRNMARELNHNFNEGIERVARIDDNHPYIKNLIAIMDRLGEQNKQQILKLLTIHAKQDMSVTEKQNEDTRQTLSAVSSNITDKMKTASADMLEQLKTLIERENSYATKNLSSQLKAITQAVDTKTLEDTVRRAANLDTSSLESKINNIQNNYLDPQTREYSNMRESIERMRTDLNLANNQQRNALSSVVTDLNQRESTLSSAVTGLGQTITDTASSTEDRIKKYIASFNNAINNEENRTQQQLLRIDNDLANNSSSINTINSSVNQLTKTMSTINEQQSNILTGVSDRVGSLISGLKTITDKSREETARLLEFMADQQQSALDYYARQRDQSRAQAEEAEKRQMSVLNSLPDLLANSAQKHTQSTLRNILDPRLAQLATAKQTDSMLKKLENLEPIVAQHRDMTADLNELKKLVAALKIQQITPLEPPRDTQKPIDNVNTASNYDTILLELKNLRTDLSKQTEANRNLNTHSEAARSAMNNLESQLEAMKRTIEEMKESGTNASLSATQATKEVSRITTELEAETRKLPENLKSVKNDLAKMLSNIETLLKNQTSPKDYSSELKTITEALGKLSTSTGDDGKSFQKLHNKLNEMTKSIDRTESLSRRNYVENEERFRNLGTILTDVLNEVGSVPNTRGIQNAVHEQLDRLEQTRQDMRVTSEDMKGIQSYIDHQLDRMGETHAATMRLHDDIRSRLFNFIDLAPQPVTDNSDFINQIRGLFSELNTDLREYVDFKTDALERSSGEILGEIRKSIKDVTLDWSDDEASMITEDILDSDLNESNLRRRPRAAPLTGERTDVIQRVRWGPASTVRPRQNNDHDDFGDDYDDPIDFDDGEPTVPPNARTSSRKTGKKKYRPLIMDKLKLHGDLIPKYLVHCCFLAAVDLSTNNLRHSEANNLPGYKILTQYLCSQPYARDISHGGPIDTLNIAKADAEVIKRSVNGGNMVRNMFTLSYNPLISGVRYNMSRMIQFLPSVKRTFSKNYAENAYNAAINNVLSNKQYSYLELINTLGYHSVAERADAMAHLRTLKDMIEIFNTDTLKSEISVELGDLIESRLAMSYINISDYKANYYAKATNDASIEQEMDTLLDYYRLWFSQDVERDKIIQNFHSYMMGRRERFNMQMEAVNPSVNIHEACIARIFGTIMSTDSIPTNMFDHIDADSIVDFVANPKKYFIKLSEKAIAKLSDPHTTQVEYDFIQQLYNTLSTIKSNPSQMIKLASVISTELNNKVLRNTIFSSGITWRDLKKVTTTQGIYSFYNQHIKNQQLNYLVPPNETQPNMIILDSAIRNHKESTPMIPGDIASNTMRIMGTIPTAPVPPLKLYEIQNHIRITDITRHYNDLKKLVNSAGKKLNEKALVIENQSPEGKKFNMLYTRAWQIINPLNRHKYNGHHLLNDPYLAAEFYNNFLPKYAHTLPAATVIDDAQRLYDLGIKLDTYAKTEEYAPLLEFHKNIEGLLGYNTSAKIVSSLYYNSLVDTLTLMKSQLSPDMYTAAVKLLSRKSAYYPTNENVNFLKQLSLKAPDDEGTMGLNTMINLNLKELNNTVLNMMLQHDYIKYIQNKNFMAQLESSRKNENYGDKLKNTINGILTKFQDYFGEADMVDKALLVQNIIGYFKNKTNASVDKIENKIKFKHQLKSYYQLQLVLLLQLKNYYEYIVQYNISIKSNQLLNPNNIDDESRQLRNGLCEALQLQTDLALHDAYSNLIKRIAVTTKLVKTPTTNYFLNDALSTLKNRTITEIDTPTLLAIDFIISHSGDKALISSAHAMAPIIYTKMREQLTLVELCYITIPSFSSNMLNLLNITAKYAEGFRYRHNKIMLPSFSTTASQSTFNSASTNSKNWQNPPSYIYLSID
jgi:hypothetical protein